MIRVIFYYLLLAFKLTFYGGQVCPLVGQIPFKEFWGLILGHFLVIFLVRQQGVLRLVRLLPLQRQSTYLFFFDYALILLSGLSVGLLNNLVFGFAMFSGLKVMIGFAAAGLIPALDLSLAWEYQILKQAKLHAAAKFTRLSYFPRTKKFAFLASGVIVFVTGVLCLLVWRDLGRIMTLDRQSLLVPGMVRSIMWDVLVVMGTFLVLVLIAVFSYARNLKLLFANQTAVLERVSQGLLDTKVPVVTDDEFAVIAGHTNEMIDNLIEKERMSQGLELARQIQGSLMPKASPLLPGIQVFGKSVFCDETGGDFYDYLVREGANGPELVIMIGDVTGHGVGSALLMTSVRAYLRAQVVANSDLTIAVKRANELIFQDTNGSGMFITAFIFCYCPSTREACWVSAGHNPTLYILSGTGEIRELQGENIPLGVTADWQFTGVADHLAPGTLFFGTDGIWEARNSSGEMFGKARICKAMAQAPLAAPEQVTEQLFAAVNTFFENARADDDQTVVIARLR